MTEQALTFTLATSDGSSTRVVLAGDIAGGAAATLSNAYDAAVESGAERIVLDFSGVLYINSSGIALLVGLLASARRDGRTLEAIGLSDHYRHVFEITRLSDYMAIVDDPG